jgi:hypothetical protein
MAILPKHLWANSPERPAPNPDKVPTAADAAEIALYMVNPTGTGHGRLRYWRFTLDGATCQLDWGSLKITCDGANFGVGYPEPPAANTEKSPEALAAHLALHLDGMVAAARAKIADRKQTLASRPRGVLVSAGTYALLEAAAAKSGAADLDTWADDLLREQATAILTR